MDEPLLKRKGKTRCTPIRFRYMFLCAVILGGGFLIYSLNSGLELRLLRHETFVPDSNRPESSELDDRFTIQTEGCSIPGLQAFDEKVLKFFGYPKQLKPCDNEDAPLLSANSTHIWINVQNLAYYNISDDNITCCYKPFFRPSTIADIESIRVDDRVDYHPCKNFSNYIEAQNEFVRVFCRYEENIVYENFFLFALKKPLKRFVYDDNMTTISDKQYYNVIILGIDAISRLNFFRTMPKTWAYLKQKDSIELLGYNKVGDNTFPNVVPMLLGERELDLKWTCWPHIYTTFDNCPFIWQRFKEAGYYTALGEDVGSLGTFNFKRFGFIRTPTDYYIHTFMREAEINVGNNKDFNSFICMGNTYFYKVLLDYVENLMSKLASFKFFGFFWEVTMSHDYLNYPMIMDDSYEAFFKRLEKLGHLENSIIILLSDHGIRWGGIRYTKQGRLEERLPLYLMLLPKTFQQHFSVAYENLKLNKYRLTTPFDIHETLKDLVDLEMIKNENIYARSETPYANKRGISLFLPVPRNRTCGTAGIDDHWCTCYKDEKLPLASAEARESSVHVVSELNSIIRPHKQCAQLSLDETLEVREVSAGTPDEDEVGWREFTVMLRTRPGDGVFEATLRYTKQRWSLSGTISRINLYGEQSWCVHHYQIKLYCYCQ